MPSYEVRTNCEYVLIVEADSVDEAMDKASKVDLSEWDQAWAPYEAEKGEDEEG